MHNGDDSAYYLAKGYSVVGIDANPAKCADCERRFAAEIDDGRMTIVSVGVSDQKGEGIFYVNQAEDTLSTFAPERFAQKLWVRQDWSPVLVSIELLSD